MKPSAEDALRRLIGDCPMCKQAPSGHRIVKFASAILSPDDNQHVDRLDQLIATRQWHDAAVFQEGRHDADVVEYYVFVCTDKKVSLLRFVFTYELWSSDWLDSSVSVSPEDGAQLVELIKGDWMEL